MAKGKGGINSPLLLLLMPLPSLLSLLPHHRPCLPLQLRCQNLCNDLHFIDCCLPPQFLLLSATTMPLLPPLLPLTLFWLPSPLLSAITTATTNANVSTAVTVNAAAPASVFSNDGLCFCHYCHHCFRMCRSHDNCHFCHSCCHFLVDCCLTHRCHCSANAIANAATS
jgi:hypothetical protein